MSVVMEADPEDVSEVVRFPEDAIVTVVVLPGMLLELVMNLEDAVEAVTLPKTEMVIVNVADDSVAMEIVLSEADDSVQAVADSVGGATRSCGSEAAEAGARVPQRD